MRIVRSSYLNLESLNKESRQYRLGVVNCFRKKLKKKHHIASSGEKSLPPRKGAWHRPIYVESGRTRHGNQRAWAKKHWHLTGRDTCEVSFFYPSFFPSLLSLGCPALTYQGCRHEAKAGSQYCKYHARMIEIENKSPKWLRDRLKGKRKKSQKSRLKMW